MFDTPALQDKNMHAVVSYARAEEYNFDKLDCTMEKHGLYQRINLSVGKRARSRWPTHRLWTRAHTPRTTERRVVLAQRFLTRFTRNSMPLRYYGHNYLLMAALWLHGRVDSVCG